MLFILILEIFLLVLSFPVKELSKNKKKKNILNSFLLWRYSFSSSSSFFFFWKLLFLFQISLFLILLLFFIFSNTSNTSTKTIIIIWFYLSILILTLISFFLSLSQSLKTIKRPFYLQVYIFILLDIFNLVLFIYGLNIHQEKDSNYWIILLILILQGIELFSFIFICILLGITWYLGRPNHQSFSSSSFTSSTSSSKSIETSQSHPYSIDFIDSNLLTNLLSSTLSSSSSSSPELDDDIIQSITLGMSFLPGRNRGNLQRSLVDDLNRIKSFYQIDVIVTLVPYDQLYEMKAPNLQGYIIDEIKLENIVFGWRDKWIPNFNSIDETISIVKNIIQKLSQKKRILIHCFGGKGRTGLIIVSILLMLGVPLPTAIDLIRVSRKGCIHNPLQLWYLNWISNYIQSNKNKIINN